MNSGQPKVVVLGAQGALGRLCVPALRGAGMDVVRAGGVRGVEDVFRLSEVRGGFEEQGIRIEAMA